MLTKMKAIYYFKFKDTFFIWRYNLFKIKELIYKYVAS